jgi:hypothetical protein
LFGSPTQNSTSAASNVYSKLQNPTSAQTQSIMDDCQYLKVCSLASVPCLFCIAPSVPSA